MRIIVDRELTRLDASGLTRKSRAWIRYLQDVEGLAVHDPPQRGYATWQRLEILRCRPR
jgi:hypothetical protein